jgi:hypothetical protein
MKTLFEKLLIQLDTLTHPAEGGWSGVNTTQKKKKNGRSLPLASLSPECYNVRGSSKKAGDMRRTPAP